MDTSKTGDNRKSVREIQLGELLEIKFRGFIVRARGFFDGLESAKMDAMIIYSNACIPSLLAFVPGHAAITGRIEWMRRLAIS